MFKHSLKYSVVSIILVVAMIVQSMIPVIRLGALSLQISNIVYAQEDDPTDLYLPLVSNPVGPPAFQIISPIDGSQVSGVTNFAIQPIEPKSISSVKFMAGSTELGTDATARDGYRIFLDASEFSDGVLELSAIASGSGGQTTETISVNIVTKAPSTGIINSSGGALASEIGSVISILPNTVPDGTQITVTEKNQEEITE